MAFLLFALAERPIDLFQKEAEKALGRPINIIDSDEMGIANGQTYCDQTPVLIKIREGFEPELRQQILAHELGHALLCGKGIVVSSLATDKGRAPELLGIVSALGSTISSCYVDPIVDDEADRRGFRTELLAEELLRKVRTHSREEIHEGVQRFGDLSADLPAIATYCTVLVPHSTPISAFEIVYADEPAVIDKLQALRRDLGKPKCSDIQSCFRLSKALRDEFSLGALITIRNPDTRQFE